MSSPPFYGYIFGVVKFAGLHATSDLPPDAWWLAALILLILGAGATIDVLTARIPDALIFLGLLAVTVTQGVYVDWPFAAEHLRLAIVAGVGIWLLNVLWQHAFKDDAIGMGDAKWTMLAVSGFGFAPALFAWGAGACLAALWISCAYLVRHKIRQVTFGPFLFIGLLAGLYWLRLR